MSVKRLYFDGSYKECMNGHIALITEFYQHSCNKSGNMSSHYRPYCKKCHNEINVRRVLENKRQKFPVSFWDCDNCDHIVSVTRKLCNKCGHDRKDTESVRFSTFCKV